jgi:large subunit ribosomal protein L24
MSKVNIKRGDSVTVIAGDDKGKSGKVLMVDTEQQRILVEGINFVKKHVPKSEEQPQGGVVDREAPVAISNVRASK